MILSAAYTTTVIARIAFAILGRSRKGWVPLESAAPIQGMTEGVGMTAEAETPRPRETYERKDEAGLCFKINALPHPAQNERTK